MQVKRKIQLGALVVIANGILVMSGLTPRVALASSCSSHDQIICSCSFPCPPVSGCTLNKSQCLNGAFAQCNFQPAVFCSYS
jgi:hypothetical protein